VTLAATDLAALLLRLALGVVFLFSGLDKVLHGTAGMVGYFADLGVPWPELLGPFVSYLELLGALLLFAGLLTRPIAVLLAADMAVAILVVRLPVASAADSVVDAVAAIRLELLLLVAAACLALLGGGRWSVDRAFVILRRRREERH
jgi:putative oxidoreductase